MTGPCTKKNSNIYHRTSLIFFAEQNSVNNASKRIKIIKMNNTKTDTG